MLLSDERNRNYVIVDDGAVDTLRVLSNSLLYQFLDVLACSGQLQMLEGVACVAVCVSYDARHATVVVQQIAVKKKNMNKYLTREK